MSVNLFVAATVARKANRTRIMPESNPSNIPRSFQESYAASGDMTRNLDSDLTAFAKGLKRSSDGVRRGRGAELVSYPAAGNNAGFALEDSS